MKHLHMKIRKFLKGKKSPSYTKLIFFLLKQKKTLKQKKKSLHKLKIKLNG